MARRACKQLAAFQSELRTTAAPAALATSNSDELVPRQTGSFDEDPRDLLELFADGGMIAAAQRPLSVLKPTKKSSRCAAFLLNQGLFDRSHN